MDEATQIVYTAADELTGKSTSEYQRRPLADCSTTSQLLARWDAERVKRRQQALTLAEDGVPMERRSFARHVLRSVYDTLGNNDDVMRDKYVMPIACAIVRKIELCDHDIPVLVGKIIFHTVSTWDSMRVTVSIMDEKAPDVLDLLLFEIVDIFFQTTRYRKAS